MQFVFRETRDESANDAYFVVSGAIDRFSRSPLAQSHAVPASSAAS